MIFYGKFVGTNAMMALAALCDDAFDGYLCGLCLKIFAFGLMQFFHLFENRHANVSMAGEMI